MRLGQIKNFSGVDDLIEANTVLRFVLNIWVLQDNKVLTSLLKLLFNV